MLTRVISQQRLPQHTLPIRAVRRPNGQRPEHRSLRGQASGEWSGRNERSRSEWHRRDCHEELSTSTFFQFSPTFQPAVFFLLIQHLSQRSGLGKPSTEKFHADTTEDLSTISS